MKPGDIEIQITLPDAAREALNNMQELPSVNDADLDTLRENITRAGISLTAAATSFAALTPAIQQFCDEFWNPLQRGFVTLQDELIAWAETYVQTRFIPDMTRFYLDIGAWRYVDPRDLTPEQRQRYQYLVLTAPFRWVWNKARKGDE